MKIYKDDATQLKFEEFVDKMITGNEVILIEECMDKFEANPFLDAVQLEQSFLSQCTIYFELIATLGGINKEITDTTENINNDTILH